MLFKRPFLLFSIILAGLFLVAIGLIQSPQFADLIKNRIARNVPSDLGVELNFRDFRLNVFPPGFSISEPNVRILPQNALGLPAESSISAKRIDFNFYLLQMFTGGFKIEEIAIHEGKLRAEVDSLEQISSPSSAQGVATIPWNALNAIRIDSISLFKTRVELIQREPQWLIQFEASRLALSQERSRGAMGYRLSMRASAIESISSHPDNIPGVVDELIFEGAAFSNGLSVEQFSVKSPFGDIQSRLNAKGNPLAPSSLEADGRLSFQIQLEDLPIPDRFKKNLAPMSGNVMGAADFGYRPDTGGEYWVQSELTVEDFNGYGYPIDRLKTKVDWKLNESAPKGALTLQNLSVEGAEKERTVQRPGQGGRITLIEPYELDLQKPSEAGRAKVKFESVHLHWLLGDLAEEIFGLTLRTSGTIEVLPIVVGRDVLELRASANLRLPFIQYDNQNLGTNVPLSRVVRGENVHVLGDFLVTEKGIAMDDVRIDFGASRMLTTGVLDFKQGFDIHWRGRVDLSDVATVVESDIAGVGALAVDLEGALDAPVLTFDFDLDGAEFLNLKFGDLGGTLRYTDSIDQIEFIDFRGSKTQATQYVAGGKIQLAPSGDRIKLDVRVQKGQIEHILEIVEELYRDLNWFPKTIVGLTEGDITIQGGLDLDTLQVFTELKGRDWDYLGEKFSIVQLSGGYDRGAFLIEELYAKKTQGVLRASLELSKDSRIAWDLQSEDFRLRDVDLLARQDVPLEGFLDIRSSGTGPIDRVQSRTNLEIRDLLVKGRRLAQGKIELLLDGSHIHFKGDVADQSLNFDLDFNLGKSGESRLRGRANRFDFTPLLLMVNPSLYQDRDLKGEFSGSLDLVIPPEGLNRMSGQIALSTYSLGKEGLSVALQEPSVLKFEKGTAASRELKFRLNQSDLKIVAGVQNGTLRGNASGAIDLGAAEIFTSLIKRREGAVSVDLNIRGTLEEPEFSGKFETKDTALRIPALEATLERMSTLLLLERGVLVMQRFEAELGGGRVRGDGQIEFFSDRWPTIQLGFGLNENRLKIAPFQFLKLTGRVALSGAERPYLLSGKVSSNSGLLKQPFLSESGQLGPSSVSVYEPPSIASNNQGASYVRLQVEAQVPGGVLIKNDLFDAEISGLVNVTNLIESPSITGKVEVKRGRLLFQDRSFQIQSAKAEFDNPTVLDPKFTLIGSTEVNEFQIKVFADGRTKRWEAEFSSEPPLPQTEILQLLALGYSTSDLSRLNAQERETVQQTRSAKLVFDALASSLNREALDKWGLEVRIDETDSTTNPTAQSVFTPGGGEQGLGGAPKVTLKKQIGKNVNVAGFRTVPGVGQGIQQGLNAEIELPKGFSLQGVYNQLEGVGVGAGAGIGQQGGVNSANQTTFGVDLKFQRRFKLNW